MVNASEEWCGFKSQVIKLVTNTGSSPVLTAKLTRSIGVVANIHPCHGWVAKLIKIKNYENI